LILLRNRKEDDRTSKRNSPEASTEALSIRIDQISKTDREAEQSS
jgi:hypothetical protein